MPHLHPAQADQAGDRVARGQDRLRVKVERHVHEPAEPRHGRVLPAPAERRARALLRIAPVELRAPRPVELLLVHERVLHVADALRHLVELAAVRLPHLDLLALLGELARGRAQVCLCDVQVVLLCFDLCGKVGAKALDHSGHVWGHSINDRMVAGGRNCHLL